MDGEVNTLKECPFCGEIPLLEKYADGPERWEVACDNPGCPAQPSVKDLIKEDAVRLWNERR